MEDKEVKRLIFVTALGIYDEVPGEFGQWIKTQIGDQLSTYRKAEILLRLLIWIIRYSDLHG